MVEPLDPKLIQPLGDRVLVEVIIEEQTKTGIFLPEQISRGRPERARVLAVGPGRYNDKLGEIVPMPFQVGDEVIFHRVAGTHIGGMSESFIVFREQDILCKILPSEEATP